MFGADIVMPHEAGFVHGQLDHPLGARGQRGFTEGRTFAPADGTFDGTDDLHRLHAQLAQHLDGDAVLFPH